MKLPNRHRSGTLLALAVLLAMTTTGYITICDVFLFGEPEVGPDIPVTVEAGDVASDITGSEFGLLYRFSLCGPVPEGVFPRLRRDGTSFGTPVVVDLVTSTSTPVGFHQIDYNEGDIGLFTEPYFAVGVVNLTVQPPTNPVTACMAVFGEGEIIVVNQTTNFYGCCSSSPENDPIVQYKWWFDYNGNPSSTPSDITTECMTTHTYTTPGTKNTRLVVRTESGEEAEDTQTIVVLGR
jgi:hypothetical protein